MNFSYIIISSSCSTIIIGTKSKLNVVKGSLNISSRELYLNKVTESLKILVMNEGIILSIEFVGFIVT